MRNQVPKNPRAGNRRGGAGVSGAGVSNAGAGGTGSEVTIETVSQELHAACRDLCDRRNLLLENAEKLTHDKRLQGDLLSRARHLDARARSILWVVEKADLQKLSMTLDPLVTLPSRHFLLLYAR